MTIPEEHLLSIAKYYGIEHHTMTFIGGMENSVYSFKIGNEERVLRIGNSNHMSYELVDAELHWIRYLSENEIPVVKPLPSVNDEFVERISVGNSSYNVVAFEKAEGKHIDFSEDPRNWDKQFVRNWGELLGRLHSVTKSYKAGKSKRYKFTPGLDSFRYKNESGEIKDYIDNLFGQLGELPTGKDEYGLVHSDIHAGNFLLMNNRISSILDFDRACYKWFASEFSIALFYPLYATTLRGNANAQKEFVNGFLPNLLTGYESENKFDSKWLEWIDLFIRVRDVILLMYNINEEWKEQNRSRIRGNEVYIDIASEIQLT